MPRSDDASMPQRTAAQPARMRLLVFGMVVDTLGSGFFAPFGLVYAHYVVGLALPLAGTLIAVGGIVGLTFGPVAGALLDRFGAARVVVAGNAVAVCAGITLLLARSPLVFALSAVFGAASSRIFWAGFSPLIGELAGAGDRERWFGRLRGVRYAGLAFGGVAASIGYEFARNTGLGIMVAVDASSYAIAGLATFAATVELRRSARARHRRRDVVEDVLPGYRSVVADRQNMLLVLLNVGCTLSCAASFVAMPVYVLDTLHTARWVPGALATATTVALAVSVSVMHRYTRGHGRLTTLAAANAMWVVGSVLFAAAHFLGGGAVAAVFVAAVAVGVAEAVYAPTADALPLALAPPGLSGRYTAAHQMAWGISGIAAPFLVGVLVGAHNATVWFAFTAIAAATGVGYLALLPSAGARVGRVGLLPPPEAAS